MKKVAIAGFIHETNSRTEATTNLDDFINADCWPKISLSNEILANFNNVNIPVAGFLEEAKKYDFSLYPILWCSAIPSGKVNNSVFEQISSDICNNAKNIKNLDALYLDLHGAMVTTEFEDGEGELLRRLRNCLSDSVTIIVSLDLHANVTPQMLHKSDLMISYRTYPHVDMAETGKRAAKMLNEALSMPDMMHYKSLEHLHFKIPLPYQCTFFEPAKSIYEKLEELESKYKVYLSYNQAFPPAEISYSYPSIIGYGRDENRLQSACIELKDFIIENRSHYDGVLVQPKKAIEYAIKKSDRLTKPIILADTQDNPGGGGSSDVVEILKELINQKARNSIVAIIHDPDVANTAHNAGVGSKIITALGGKTELKNQSPLVGEFKVINLSNGQFEGTGPFYHNCHLDLGKTALLSIEDVEVIVSSKKIQAADQAIFTHLDVDPTTKSIISLKSSVHFRADFQNIASEIVVVEAPGFNY